MSDGLASLVEHFLAAHLELHPVDASFMGIPGHDHRLPPAGRGVEDGEAATWEGLEREAAALPEPGTPTERIELAMLLAQVRLARRELAE
ncbi:MAG TPA: DUF885 domain-containing protein, partial [Deinococcales bacterium]|nr:DUF885 domain-containing protein [Deinococcales bacterium]